ncbi:hypothetical protein PIROE2DRAFT_7740 [Piromyces sp. E2]|nr:hypothetical protein PIROE2DRAFT_7740 [Piromyces sp. E2]|eukprot:OUM65280.1 hypothetical protein PIROE2DRAFT_7740 [Piromyces sp. E2]
MDKWTKNYNLSMELIHSIVFDEHGDGKEAYLKDSEKLLNYIPIDELYNNK